MRTDWPALPFDSWADTLATLHRYTQIVGKVRMELTPRLNHWWNVGLHVGVRGLETGPIPYRGGLFSVEFDFLVQALVVRTSEGGLRSLLERDVLGVVGRAEGLGRPLLYGTTPQLLEVLGIRSLEELPRLEELSVALRPPSAGAELGET